MTCRGFESHFLRHSILAQMVEQQPVKLKVLGPSPRGRVITVCGPVGRVPDLGSGDA